jgi:hypothetical protein
MGYSSEALLFVGYVVGIDTILTLLDNTDNEDWWDVKNEIHAKFPELGEIVINYKEDVIKDCNCNNDVYLVCVLKKYSVGEFWGSCEGGDEHVIIPIKTISDSRNKAIEDKLKLLGLDYNLSVVSTHICG